MTYVDEFKKFMDDFARLARLALQGKQTDADIFVRRLAKRYEHLAPELSERLTSLLRNAPVKPASGSVLRGGTVERMPVDVDSRLSLARIEHPVELENEPHWSAEVHRNLEGLIFERMHEEALITENLLPSHTALFTGPPGVGKTLAARWIAAKLDRPLVTLDLAAVMSSFLGRTGTNVRNVLDYAKGISCVFLLDEFDAIAKRRDDLVEVGELKRLVTVLLQEIDVWPASGLLIAATNHDELLDPAVWRRFEVVVRFPMPSEANVRRAVELFLGPTDLSERWLRILVSVLTGTSYADIARELKRARRWSVLHGDSVQTQIERLVNERVHALKRGKRVELAVELVNAGLSQREAHSWTGVSRDTIRKHRETRR